jgi:oligogalacturonide lyase
VAREITRRILFSLLPGVVRSAVALPEQRAKLPPAVGEFYRFADPVTEALVVRLTTPAYTNVLPSPANRFVSLKPRTLFCSSDRTGGKMAPFEVDLGNGVLRQLSEADSLDPNSLTLDQPGHFLYFLDGSDLIETPVKMGRTIKRGTVLGKNVSAFSLARSRSELFVLRAGLLEQLRGNAPITLADGATGPCFARPNGTGCLFTRLGSGDEKELWYASVSNPGKPMLIARGAVSSPQWSADGESVLFLRDVPQASVLLSEVFEVKPEEGTEHCVSKTSQFASFAPNGDVSVFVGASRSQAQPNVLILLRSTHREMTLCEHRASHPQDVRPVFSPDSRRVYFQSDREGKSAIYSVNVEQLVEPL